MTFYWKPNCTTCRREKKLLEERGVPFEEVDLNQGISTDRLDAIIGERDYRKFLNSRNELYRARGMKHNPPSRVEALHLMSENPNLILRPMLVDESGNVSWPGR